MLRKIVGIGIMFVLSPCMFMGFPWTGLTFIGMFICAMLCFSDDPQYWIIIETRQGVHKIGPYTKADAEAKAEELNTIKDGSATIEKGE